MTKGSVSRRARRAGGLARTGTLVAAGLVVVGGVGLVGLSPAVAANPVGGTLALVAGVTHTPATGPATGSDDLNAPFGAAVDPSTGDVYIADSGNNVVEEVTPAGVQSIVAGVVGQSGAPTPGPATASDLSGPSGLAFDPVTGDLYIADTGNNVIEQVSSTGQLSIVAGTGTAGAPTAGPATASALDDPFGVAVDSATGDLYIADTGNSVIEQVSSTGQLSIVAGTGTAGTPGAAGPDLNYPSGIAVDSATGDLYIADTDNNVVERVTPSGGFSIVAGNGTSGPATAGLPTASELNAPSGVAVDPSTGNLYIADTGNNEIEQLSASSGFLTVIAGGGTVAPTKAPAKATKNELDAPSGVAFDPTDANLIIADTTDNFVEQLSAPGQLSVIAGGVGAGVSSPGGPGTASELSSPASVAVDTSSGDLYIADTSNNVIEQITPSDQLSIVAGTGVSGAPTAGLAPASDLSKPGGVAVDPATGDLYIADTSNNVVEKVTPSGRLSIVAGTGTLGPPTAGPATASELSEPSGVAVDPSTGYLYIADTSNNVIEQVTPSGQLSIVAGSGRVGAPSPGPATASALDGPAGVAVDPATGALYIADSANNAVEQVSSSGQLSVVAGSVSGVGGTPAPGPATASGLTEPSGVAVDPTTGHVFIADTGNSVVEEVTPSGQLSIAAGSLSGLGGAPTPGPATASELINPSGVAFDSATDQLFIADTANNDVESVSFS